jgi:hypothetical protein
MRRSSISQEGAPAPGNSEPRFTRRDQFRYAALACSSTTILLIGRLLRPAAAGVGTHEQLGLPPCAFLHFTGIPCPACGLTTSVAHATRLHIFESILTQPFGFVVFLLAVLSVPLSIYLSYRRIPLSTLAEMRGRKGAAGLMLSLFLLSWFYKIAVMKGLLHG